MIDPERNLMAKIEMVEVENVNHPDKVSRVNAAQYTAMKTALLKALPKGKPGLTQAEMGEAVLSYLPEDLWPGGEKAMWWVKAVQLDLEAKGIMERDTSSSPTRWYQV